MAQRLGGRWEIVESIGEGGQGRTFRVRDLTTKSTNWILKKLKNRNRLDRFEREIQALRKVDSPHIPKVEDVSTVEPAYLVIPDVGVDLTRHAMTKNLDLKSCMRLFDQLCRAVQDAHSVSVVHRDIKPNNIVLSDDGKTVSLIDFGICQYADAELVTLTLDEPLGNPAYAAPECFLGSETEPGTACDVYSLAKVLYWLVSGGHYIHREVLSDFVVRRIKSEHDLIRYYVSRLLRGAITERPEARWSIGKLLEELDNTRTLIERHAAFRKEGFIVLEDRLGPKDSFSTTNSQSATTPPAGNPPDAYCLGVPFSVPAGEDLHLASFSLALCSRRGVAEGEVLVCEDRDGAPNESRVLAILRIQVTTTSALHTFKPENEVRLSGGQTYWLVLRARGEGANIQLWSAPTDFMPFPTRVAERGSASSWKVARSSAGPGHAVRVLARPIRRAAH